MSCTCSFLQVCNLQNENNVTNSDQAIQCDVCASWFHIKCNDLNYIDYKSLQILMILGFPSHAVAKLSLLILWKKIISNFYDSNKTLMKKIALYY